MKEKRKHPQQVVLRKLDVCMQKNEIISVFITLPQNSVQMYQRSKC